MNRQTRSGLVKSSVLPLSPQCIRRFVRYTVEMRLKETEQMEKLQVVGVKFTA